MESLAKACGYSRCPAGRRTSGVRGPYPEFRISAHYPDSRITPPTPRNLGLPGAYIERTNAWNDRPHRLSKDHDRNLAASVDQARGGSQAPP